MLIDEPEDGLTVTTTSGGYFVCCECAHTWSEPAFPDSCENCSAPSFMLTRFDSLDDAEEHSEEILQAMLAAQKAKRKGS